MGEIPEGFELYVDEDGDQLWLDIDGVQRFVGPGCASEPGPGWRAFYVGPPPPKPRSLEDKVRDLAARFDRQAIEAASLSDPGRWNVWRDAADDLRILLDDVDQ